jgi:hypothetical protein
MVASGEDASADSRRIHRRLGEAARTSWPSGSAGWVLSALLALGVVLRILAVVSVRPATILEDNYQAYAHYPFLDPLHPAGYGLILAAIGKVTHNLNAVILPQHVAGIASALLLGAATRRVTGSSWAGLLPAAMLLLSGDVVYLEHSVMSETFEILAVSVGLYATVRALDRPAPWFYWPLVAGAALAIAVMIRSDSLPLIVVAFVTLVFGRPGSWRRRWPAPLALAATAAVLLLGYSAASAGYGTRFGIAPSPGWYLYTRVAQFADCTRFTPPPGTASLCQSIPPAKRPGGYYYQTVPTASPALRLTGGFGREDGLIGSWAERALRAQFGAYLQTGWQYFRGYFVPSTLPARYMGQGLDPQVSFANKGNIYTVVGAQQALNAFFGTFSFRSHTTGVAVLRRWQLIVRFGASALFVTALLTLLGLVLGTRRSRIGVLLFGVGGLSLLVEPALNSTFAGRYTVPVSGPLMAAAAITISEIWRMARRRRSRTGGGV